MFSRSSCALLLLPLLFTTYASAEEPLFPFVVSYDAPANVTNVADLLERPAGKHGFVHAENGRLVVGEAGEAKPIRFWATNICFDACFPPHEQAERWPPGWPGWASTACGCTTWIATRSGATAPIT